MKSENKIPKLHSRKKCSKNYRLHNHISSSIMTTRVFNNTSRSFLLNVQHLPKYMGTPLQNCSQSTRTVYYRGERQQIRCNWGQSSAARRQTSPGTWRWEGRNLGREPKKAMVETGNCSWTFYFIYLQRHLLLFMKLCIPVILMHSFASVKRI